MLSKYCNWISCDVETGGLISGTKKATFDVALTEIALVAINENSEIIDEKSWLIKPYKEGLEYNIHAEEASGISKQMCIDQGLDIKLVCAEVIQFLKKYKAGNRLPKILGHCFPDFDAFFITGMFEFCNEDLMKYIQNEAEDTIKFARMCWPESTNYKLGTCCENAGITLVDAHRALADARVTGLLWIYFMKRLRGVGQQSLEVETVKTFRATFEL